MKKLLITLTLVAFLGAMASCKAKKSYPDTDPGWHSADFSVVLGRLVRIPAKNTDDPAVWVVRFGLGREAYRGELALMPADKLVGYSGGELVKIRGSVKEGYQHPQYAGTWYEVSSIRMWDNYTGK